MYSRFMLPEVTNLTSVSLRNLYETNKNQNFEPEPDFKGYGKEISPTQPGTKLRTVAVYSNAPATA